MPKGAWKELRKLGLAYNQIQQWTHLTACARLPNLLHLDLTGNELSEVEYKNGYRVMEILELAQNQISDVSSLNQLNEILELTQLSISGNPVAVRDDAHVLGRIRNIKVLDEKNITNDQKSKAEIGYLQ